MKKLRIGIQGITAAFHDIAAQNYFNSTPIETIKFRDFSQLSEAVANKQVDYAVMAIENTIGGSILPNYAFIQEYGLAVLGEEYLKISMQLMALQGETLDTIQEVISHSMALRQCADFLRDYPEWKISEANDTAESARYISENRLEGVAAIAGSLAASTYGLEIISSNIETNKQNYTRFLVLGKNGENHIDECDKASIRMVLAHEPGALSRSLHVLDEYRLNLTKIQSVPILGKPYEYAIHFDVEFADHHVFKAAMTQIVRLTNECKVMGIYKKGKTPVVV